MRNYLFIGLLVLFAHLCLTKNLKKNSLAKVNSSSSSQFDIEEAIRQELEKQENARKERQRQHMMNAQAAWKQQAIDDQRNAQKQKEEEERNRGRVCQGRQCPNHRPN